MKHVRNSGILVVVLVAGSLVSVMSTQTPTKPEVTGNSGAQSSQDTTPTSYKCTGGIKLKAEFNQGDPGSAKVTYRSSIFDLPQVRSASGAKYSKGKVTFWTKGNEATFQRKGKTYKCTSQT